MSEFRFLKLRVYDEAKVLYRKTVFLTKTYPQEFHYLKDQLRRAALSIVLNIAEGSGKSSDVDFRRFIYLSLGSIHELIAGFDISLADKLIEQQEFSAILIQAENLKNQLGSFVKRLSAGG